MRQSRNGVRSKNTTLFIVMTHVMNEMRMSQEMKVSRTHKSKTSSQYLRKHIVWIQALLFLFNERFKFSFIFDQFDCLNSILF